MGVKCWRHLIWALQVRKRHETGKKSEVAIISVPEIRRILCAKDKNGTFEKLQLGQIVKDVRKNCQEITLINL